MLAYHDKLVHTCTEPHYHHKSQTKTCMSKNAHPTHVYEIPTYIPASFISTTRKQTAIYASSACGATSEHVGQNVVRGGDHILRKNQLRPSFDNFVTQISGSKKKKRQKNQVFFGCQKKTYLTLREILRDTPSSSSPTIDELEVDLSATKVTKTSSSHRRKKKVIEKDLST